MMQMLMMMVRNEDDDDDDDDEDDDDDGEEARSKAMHESAFRSDPSRRVPKRGPHLFCSKSSHSEGQAAGAARRMLWVLMPRSGACLGFDIHD